ncbi:hypothetical protein HK096_011648, partial [Nowakowskiella sp. JEL0078]
NSRENVNTISTPVDPSFSLYLTVLMDYFSFFFPENLQLISNPSYISHSLQITPTSFETPTKNSQLITTPATISSGNLRFRNHGAENSKPLEEPELDLNNITDLFSI